MNRRSPSRARSVVSVNKVAAAALVLGGLLLAACGSSSTSPTTTSSTTTSSTTTGSHSSPVLDAAYASSAGFPKTVQAAKTEKVTDQKGCSSSVAAAYEDAVGKTGLLSDVLKCGSSASASAALSEFRKTVTLDPSLAVPKGLGSTAFAGKGETPEYLLVWQSGSNVAITALDVDVAATSATKTFPALTAAQTETLSNAALQQNSLY
jgi:hypothetical protein